MYVSVLQRQNWRLGMGKVFTCAFVGGCSAERESRARVLWSPFSRRKIVVSPLSHHNCFRYSIQSIPSLGRPGRGDGGGGKGEEGAAPLGVCHVRLKCCWDEVRCYNIISFCIWCLCLCLVFLCSSSHVSYCIAMILLYPDWCNYKW